MPIGHFLAGIGALIQDPATSRYLLLRRADNREFKAGDWECVTGRVEQGESFEDALHREVMEETGLTVQVDFIIGTTHFYRGAATPDNELLGILYSCTTTNKANFQIDHEHSECRWVSSSEASSMLEKDSWMIRTIERAEYLRKILPREIISYSQSQGFEI